jgi:DNA-binding NarL/FixJ family response regulator
MTTLIRLLIVDDHTVVREGLQTLLADEPGIEIIGEAATGTQAVRLAIDLHPDVVLMDLVMPDMDGIAATRLIQRDSPGTRILVLTTFADDQRVRDAILAGAVGYLLKDVLKPDLLRAIQAAAQGIPTLHPEAQRHLMRHMAHPEPRSPVAELTQRERDVLRLIAGGHNNRDIAAMLHLTEGTVKGYVSTILAKLGLADRTQAALYAMRHGLGPDTH